MPLSSLSRSSNPWPDPSACQWPAYTVYDTHAQLLHLLLSCFTLRHPRSVASYLMMPPPLWGVLPRILLCCSLLNFNTSSKEVTIWLLNQYKPQTGCDFLCDWGKKLTILSSSKVFDFIQACLHQKGTIYSLTHFRLHHPLFILSLHIKHFVWLHHKGRRIERKRQKNKVICLAAFVF